MIVVTPDSFKKSMSSEDACAEDTCAEDASAAMTRGARRVWPEEKVVERRLPTAGKGSGCGTRTIARAAAAGHWAGG